MIEYLIKLGLSLFLGGLIGIERETQSKNAGLRTIMSICFGATLITIFTLEFVEITKLVNVNFDAIRAIAYYMVAVGFGNLVFKGKGITTSAILLPVCCVGFFVGIGKFELAIISALCIYGILLLKYVKVKIQLFINKNGKKKRKKK